MSTTQDFCEIQMPRQLVSAMKEAGSHYWDKDTMRFFDSCGPFNTKATARGVYFLTSEQFHGSHGSEPRRWTVRRWDGETVHDCGEFQAHATKRSALKSLARFASGLDS